MSALACESDVAHVFGHHQFQSIVSEACFDATCACHIANFRRNFLFVAAHNFRPAMRNDGSRHAFLPAPAELRPNRRMTDQRIATLANERARERRAVADVNLHASERCRAVVNEQEIGPIKNARMPGGDAISDGRSQDRMLNRERFERDPTNFGGGALLDQVPIVDLAISQRSPRFLRRVHRARRAVF